MEMEKSLKTFQELVIKGREEDLNNFFEILTEDLEQKGWKRSTNDEKKYELYTPGYRGVFVKTPILEGKLEAEITLISKKGQNEYKIANIIPLSKPSLDYDEYNKILSIFYNSFVKDKYGKYNLDVELSEPITSLSEYLSEKSILLLENFSQFANKNTGSAHPSDHERWNEFIINVFKEGEKIPIDMLIRWLIEIGGWSESISRELVIEFEFGMELLKRYNEVFAEEAVTAR